VVLIYTPTTPLGDPFVPSDVPLGHSALALEATAPLFSLASPQSDISKRVDSFLKECPSLNKFPFLPEPLLPGPKLINGVSEF